MTWCLGFPGCLHLFRALCSFLCQLDTACVPAGGISNFSEMCLYLSLLPSAALSQWRAGLEGHCGPGCQCWADLRHPEVSHDPLHEAFCSLQHWWPCASQKWPPRVELAKWLLLLQYCLLVMHFFKYLPTTALCQDVSWDRLSCTFSSCSFNSGQHKRPGKWEPGEASGFWLVLHTVFYLLSLRPTGGHCFSGFKMKPCEIGVRQSGVCPTKVPVCSPEEGS